MSCGCDSGTGPISLAGYAWTAGSTSTEVFVPLSRPMLVGSWSEFKISAELRDDTGDIKVKPAVQYSNDGVTWSSATGIGSWLTTTGFHYASGLTATDESKTMFRLGMLAVNETGSTLEQMRVYTTIDMTER